MRNLENMDSLNEKIDTSERQSVQINVEIYTTYDSGYGVYISHDNSSGVEHLNVKTSEDIASCVEKYIDIYL